MLSALQRTHSAAQAILKKVAPHVSPPTSNLGTSQVTRTLPPLVLPPERALSAQLISKGVTKSIAERVSNALSRVVGCLKETLEEDYRRRGRLAQTQTHFAQDPKLPSLLQSAYLTLYAKTVRDWTTYILSDFVPRLLQAQILHSQRSSSPDGTSRRRPFNQNAVPLLEQAFSKDAFPSRLDKVELASLCEMDYRQVHVWFQNRRSRCRKEGRELTRRSQSPLLVELESSVDAILNDLDDDDDDSREASQISCSSDTATSFVLSTPGLVPGFHLETPDHAFPHPYPPQCPYDPFPMGSKAPALQLPWLRTLSSAVDGSNLTPPDIASLTITFSKLSLCDTEAERMSPSASPSISVASGQGLGSYLGFVTPCATAPHPALARRCRRIARAPRVSTSMVPGGVRVAHSERSTRSCQWRAQKRSTTPSTVVPPYDPPALGSHITRRTLPRRVPKHPPVRREMPNSSPYSTTTSRLVSTSSTMSSGLSSASSGTSTESDIESPLTTPPLLPDLVIGSVEQLVPPFILNHSEEWGDPSYFDSVAALSNENLFSFSDKFFPLTESATSITY